MSESRISKTKNGRGGKGEDLRCNEWDADFMKFAASGDSTEEFLEHLGSCNSCLKAVEAEFFLQMLHTERYAEKLLKSKLKKAALP